MVACTAGFDNDRRWWKFFKESYHVLSPKFLSQNNLFIGANTMKLKNLLRRIHPNSSNIFHGRSPLSDICNDLILAHFDAAGGRPHHQGASPIAFWSRGLRCSGKMPDMNGRAWLGTGRAIVPEKLKQAVDGDSGLLRLRELFDGGLRVF